MSDRSRHYFAGVGRDKTCVAPTLWILRALTLNRGSADSKTLASPASQCWRRCCVFFETLPEAERLMSRRNRLEFIEFAQNHGLYNSIAFVHLA